MGSIRDKILRDERNRRKSDGGIGPKTSIGNYKKIRDLESRIRALESTVDRLQNRIEELEEGEK